MTSINSVLDTTRRGRLGCGCADTPPPLPAYTCHQSTYTYVCMRGKAWGLILLLHTGPRPGNVIRRPARSLRPERAPAADRRCGGRAVGHWCTSHMPPANQSLPNREFVSYFTRPGRSSAGRPRSRRPSGVCDVQQPHGMLLLRGLMTRAGCMAEAPP